MKKLLSIYFLLLIAFLSSSQEKAQLIGNCSTCDEVCNDKSQYIRIYSENDFWKLRGTTDRYFTNGIKIDYFFLPPGTKAGLLDYIFFNLPFKRNGKPNATRNNNFAISFGMNQYTPADLSNPGVDSSDRPYAGWMFGAIKCISNDFGTAERLSTEYSFGVIGPSAHQKYVQTKWHDIFDFEEPGGWDNQIQNDFALNVNVVYEKGVVNPIGNMEWIANIEANVGTVTNYFGIGSTFRLGIFNDYFLNEFGLRQGENKIKRYKECTDKKNRTTFYEKNLDRKFQFYTFIKPSFRAIVDNSLLQGGIWSYKRSPYILTADRIKRFYANAEFGLCLIYKGIGLTFSQLFRTAEFEGAKISHWGAITLTIKTKK